MEKLYYQRNIQKAMDPCKAEVWKDYPSEKNPEH